MRMGWAYSLLRHSRFLLRYLGNNNEDIVRIWEIFLEHPVFSIDISADGVVFAGIATGDVVAVNIGNNGTAILGKHNAPICKVFWIDKYSILASLGFDNVIKFWGLEPNNGTHLLKEFELP